MHKKSPAAPFSKFIIVAPAIIIISLIFFDNSADTRNLQEEYKQMQREMKTQRKKLESVKKTERNIVEELKKMNSELSEIEVNLIAQRKKIKDLNDNIHKVQYEINNYTKNLADQKKLLKKRITVLQRMTHEIDPFLIVLSGEDPTVVLKTIRYLKDISAYDQALIKKYNITLYALNEKHKKLKTFSADLQTEETKFKNIEHSLKEKKNERERLLVSVRKEKSHYENMIRSLREASNKMQKIIEESERRERELRKKKGVEPKPGIKDEDLPEYNAFTRMKGRLLWPVTGTVVVPYGSQVDPIFNLPVFRSGIHIKTSPNSHVRAVHDGKVVFADSFKGFGQLIIVNHGGGYHTLYGNLSRIFLQNDAIIKERQTIGETGESQLLGTAGLYFEIRFKGKPLNPEHWLRKS
ncbi:MAG: peptidoglycan DD-metalloendopeptidase family protein [Bacteroidetes bacterium]|nr:peptidoglycan DD-metalloendopeptidase family protein [Bacteroidota bacterium]